MDAILGNDDLWNGWMQHKSSQCVDRQVKCASDDVNLCALFNIGVNEEEDRIGLAALPPGSQHVICSTAIDESRNYNVFSNKELAGAVPVEVFGACVQEIEPVAANFDVELAIDTVCSGNLLIGQHEAAIAANTGTVSDTLGSDRRINNEININNCENEIQSFVIINDTEQIAVGNLQSDWLGKEESTYEPSDYVSKAHMLSVLSPQTWATEKFAMARKLCCLIKSQPIFCAAFDEIFTGDDEIEPPESPYVTSMYIDSFKDVENDLLAETELQKQCAVKVQPFVCVSINDVIVDCLVDSGSNISCVSESFYNTVKCADTVTYSVSSVKVKTATGNFSKPIKREVIFEINIDGEVYVQGFFIVPNLCTSVLVGTDFLTKHKCVIYFEQRLIEISAGEYKKRVKFKGSLSGEKMMESLYIEKCDMG